jgi:hypothetical protein
MVSGQDSKSFVLLDGVLRVHRLTSFSFRNPRYNLMEMKT